MARNMHKKVDDYNKKFLDETKNPTGKGTFYANDYQEIEELARAKGGETWDYIDAAIKAGFMCGYELAKKELKQSKI